MCVASVEYKYDDMGRHDMTAPHQLSPLLLSPSFSPSSKSSSSWSLLYSICISYPFLQSCLITPLEINTRSHHSSPTTFLPSLPHLIGV